LRINSGDNDGIETILVKKNKKGTTFYLLSLVNTVCSCSQIKNGLKIGHLNSCAKQGPKIMFYVKMHHFVFKELNSGMALISKYSSFSCDHFDGDVKVKC